MGLAFLASFLSSKKKNDITNICPQNIIIEFIYKELEVKY